MNKHSLNLLAVIIIMFSYVCGFTQTAQASDKKVYIGQPFKYFDLTDIYNQRWVSTYLRGKPVIILTAHRNQKYEVAKWAEALYKEFGTVGSAHLLWVVNMNHMPWTTSKREVIEHWRDLHPSIPVLLDWTGVIGRSIRVNYHIPNIIVLDVYGRLAMHEMHSFNFEVYSAVAARIRVLCSAIPGYVGAPNAGSPYNQGKSAYSY